MKRLTLCFMKKPSMNACPCARSSSTYHGSAIASITSHAQRIAQQAQRPQPFAARHAVRADRERRHEQRDRALGQQAEPHPRVCRDEIAAPTVDEVAIEREQRAGDERVEQRIRGRRARHHERTERAHQHERRHVRGVGREATGEAEQQPAPEPARQRGRQPERPLDRSGDAHRGRLQPVGQDRLVEAQLAVEPRGHVIAACEHLARRFRECAFVHVDQRRRAEVEEQHQRAVRREQPAGPGNESGGRGSRASGGRRLRRQHGGCQPRAASTKRGSIA